MWSLLTTVQRTCQRFARLVTTDSKGFRVLLAPRNAEIVEDEKFPMLMTRIGPSIRRCLWNERVYNMRFFAQILDWCPNLDTLHMSLKALIDVEAIEVLTPLVTKYADEKLKRTGKCLELSGWPYRLTTRGQFGPHIGCQHLYQDNKELALQPIRSLKLTCPSFPINCSEDALGTLLQQNQLERLIMPYTDPVTLMTKIHGVPSPDARPALDRLKQLSFFAEDPGIQYITILGRMCNNLTHLAVAAWDYRDEDLQLLSLTCKQLAHVHLTNCRRITGKGPHTPHTRESRFWQTLLLGGGKQNMLNFRSLTALLQSFRIETNIRQQLALNDFPPNAKHIKISPPCRVTDIGTNSTVFPKCESVNFEYDGYSEYEERFRFTCPNTEWSSLTRAFPNLQSLYHPIFLDDWWQRATDQTIPSTLQTIEFRWHPGQQYEYPPSATVQKCLNVWRVICGTVSPALLALVTPDESQQRWNAIVQTILSIFPNTRSFLFQERQQQSIWTHIRRALDQVNADIVLDEQPEEELLTFF